MAFDIEETKARTITIKAREARRQHRQAATDKGFKRLEDYDAWLALEELARVTLEARRIVRGDFSAITINDSSHVSISGSQISGAGFGITSKLRV